VATAEWVNSIYSCGIARWTQVRLDPEALARHVERVGLTNAATPSIHASDFFLACACLHRDAAALMEFERLLKAHVPAFVARIDGSDTFVDEVRQRLRERLLSGSDPKLTRYSGAGSLLGWIRVVAVRTALDLKRTGATREVGHIGMAERLVQTVATQEIDLIKTEFRAAFEQAIAVAVRQLTTRHRAVLRLYLLASANIDQIAGIYRVHRSTVARWIASSEAFIFDAAKVYLREHHEVATTDFDSMGRLLRSSIQLSLDRLLRS
jgi:RNA polymerase sigma-70 factor (ECF subfamily)